VRKGSVFQRHCRACPRGEGGEVLPHKCRGPWSYYVLAGRGPDGRRRQVTRSGFASKRDAEAALRDVASREASEIAAVHRLTTEEYLTQWLDGKRALRVTTRESYASHLRLYLKPWLGHVLLADLRPAHLDPMYEHLLAGTNGEQRTVATVQRVHATLRSALNTAVKRRLIPWNPALHVELPPSRKPTTGVWTPEQLGAFLDHIIEDRLYAFFHIVALLGLRRGEALGLRWIDIDPGKSLLRVSQQLTETRTGLHFGPPKTRSGIRVVSLDTETVQVILEHQARQDEERKAWGQAWVDCGLVFVRENGEALRPDFVTHRFARLSREAGLERIRLHDLRHTSASLALSAGVPMKVVSDRLGHSSTAITADLYTHVVPVLAQDAADRIAAVVPRRLRASRNSMSSECLASGDLRDPKEPG